MLAFVLAAQLVSAQPLVLSRTENAKLWKVKGGVIMGIAILHLVIASELLGNLIDEYECSRRTACWAEDPVTPALMGGFSAFGIIYSGVGMAYYSVGMSELHALRVEPRANGLVVHF